jgi:DNA polymerase III delta prime subunit
MIPFIYKYMPTLEEFECDSKSSLCRHTNLLLLGSKRTGKTTLAGLLSDGLDSDHLLHINMLKDQGVQYYRNEMKTFCQSTTKHKKIVIDGLDEMNEQTQQIFLTYMTMYPSIQFILTGTNPQKIIESMYSSCVVIRLSPVSDTYLRTLLHRVCKEEGIELIEEETILDMSRPSVRTMLNYLEKYKLLNMPITNDHFKKTCTTIPFSILDDFFLNKKDVLTQLYEEGYSVIDILETCYDYIKLSEIQDEKKYKYIKLISKYMYLFNVVHEHPIELLHFTNDCFNISNDSHNSHRSQMLS